MLVDGELVGLATGTSAMVEEERLNPDGIAPSEEAVRLNARSSTYATLELRPSGPMKWTTTAYMQPLFTSVEDYRLVVESGLAFSVTKTLSFTVDARYRKDSKPPATTEGSPPILATDFNDKNGLKLTL